MRRVIVHHTQQRVRVRISSGNNFFIRARWGIRPGLIAEPPTEPRRPDHFFENPEVFVSRAATPENPYFLDCDPLWWEVQRLTERNVFTIVETRLEATLDPRVVETFQWAINHDPVANAGPDQLIPLDLAGAVPRPVGVMLDGSASTDIDLSSIDPDPGPLTFVWSSSGVPVGAESGGTAAAAAHIAATATATWLLGGTVVPQHERGIYMFDLKVCDREPAEIGVTRGRPGENTASVRILLGPTSDVLAILAPTHDQPYFGNYDEGVSVVIHYAIGDSLANHPAYGGSWVVRLSIKQAINSPYTLPRATGSVVYTEERVSGDRIGTFVWNGLANHDLSGVRSASPTTPVVGAYDVEVEVLDRDWQPTGVIGSTRPETRAIVLDLFRWRTPLETVPFENTVLSGTFMETGHAGYGATSLHGGIDLVATGGPDVYAARSGTYQHVSDCAHSNVIQVGRRGSYRAKYLHCDTLEPHAADSIVLQGSRLGRMSNCGPPNTPVHLHFQLETVDHTDNVIRVVNPLSALSVADTATNFPRIEAVLLRATPGAGAADLTRTGPMFPIAGAADLIVLCRDNAYPSYTSSNGSFLTIYRLDVWEDGVAWPASFVLDAFDPAAKTAADYYVRQGIGTYHGNVPRLYYLLYRRWDTAPYARAGGSRRYQIRVSDFVGRSAEHVLTIGCDVGLITPATHLQMTAAAPAPITIQLAITNRLSGLFSDNVGNIQESENFHAALAGQPAGWTLAPSRTGAINSGATLPVSFQLDPGGSALAGVHTFDIVVSSDVVRNIGTRVRVSIMVT